MWKRTPRYARCSGRNPRSRVDIDAAVARRRAGVAYIVASAVCFGAMAIMARFAYASGVDTTTLLAWPRGKTLAMLFAGLERVGPTRAAVLSTIEPVCTVLL